jgi:hypothetical protein
MRVILPIGPATADDSALCKEVALLNLRGNVDKPQRFAVYNRLRNS